MSNKKEFVKEIAKIDENFAQWYTDIVVKAELADYTTVKGFIAIRPYGYAIWENIQNYADKRFKENGVKNVSMPVLIPETLLNKEKEHVEGFAPEVAWVTIGGQEKLEEKLCIRPTSETIFSSMYSKWLNSWRDLPYLYNQWCSVLRWEKETRPFLRSREFLWQEGHTIHETAEEAKEFTLKMLDVYADVIENLLAIPVLKGQKTPKEQFAGAEATYTVETLMHDGRALQGGTSHYFGQNFTKSFDVKFQNRKGTIIEDRIDEPDLYAVLYKNTDEHGQPVTLKGDDVLTHPNIVALARIQNPVHDFNTWTRFDIPFEYSGNVDEKLLKAYGYNLAVVFTSSIEGASFCGAVGSTLLVDEVKVVCEE